MKESEEIRESMGLHRGKRLDNGKWAYGFYAKELRVSLRSSDKDRLAHVIIYLDNDLFVPDYVSTEVYPFSVGMISGSKDALTGKPIYERDLIRFKEIPQKPQGLYEVVYGHGTFYLKEHKPDWFFKNLDGKPMIDFGYAVYVVGNTFENKEMLDE